MSKLSKLIFVIFTGVFCSQLSFAKVNHDPCGDLPGSWSGVGELTYFVFSCKYESTAVVDSANPSSANVKIRKVSGSVLCPSQGEEHLAVSCHDGRVVMKDAKIDVAGNISPDGQSVNLEGNLYAMFRYHPFKLSVSKDLR